MTCGIKRNILLLREKLVTDRVNIKILISEWKMDSVIKNDFKPSNNNYLKNQKKGEKKEKTPVSRNVAALLLTW